MYLNIFIALGLGMFLLGQPASSHWQERTLADSTATQYTFQKDIAPLLKTNCTPCHFEGGTVVGTYPFEDYKTVKKLGERLNTRLKEEAQQNMIVEWLKTGAKEK